mmetsp:Transcript_22618/g.70922  ORF Transcript_22618/g.70922 Transcript_22618/m.70922 type:complete len:234 (-) Transcript_22618:552-1253(-)
MARRDVDGAHRRRFMVERSQHRVAVVSHGIPDADGPVVRAAHETRRLRRRPAEARVPDRRRQVVDLRVVFPHLRPEFDVPHVVRQRPFPDRAVPRTRPERADRHEESGNGRRVPDGRPSQEFARVDVERRDAFVARREHGSAAVDDRVHPAFKGVDRDRRHADLHETVVERVLVADRRPASREPHRLADGPRVQKRDHPSHEISRRRRLLHGRRDDHRDALAVEDVRRFRRFL